MATHAPRAVLALVAAAVLTGCFLESSGKLRQGWDGSTMQDSDGDGVPDDQPDNCPSTPNRSQADFDGDGIGNICDPDAEGQDVDEDGIDDSIDLCEGERSGPNEDGDVYPSAPWQIVDDCDNCPSVPNSDQANGDMDDIGDACEAPGDEDSFRSILFFDRLRDDLMGWRILDYSGWDFNSGELEADPIAVLHAVVPDEIVDRAGSSFAIETDVRMQESDGDLPYWSGIIIASVLNPSRTALEAWHACVLMVDPAGEMEIHVALRSMEAGCTEGDCTLGALLRDEPTGVTFEPGTAYRLYALKDGNSIGCHMGPSADEVTGSITMTVASLYEGGPGLTAARAPAAFLRATVYGP